MPATTGITVHLEAEEKNLAGVPGCLIGEVFYLVAEGLSNIRRHTQATAAEIIIRQRNLLLYVGIADNGSTIGPTRPVFQPRSLTERAGLLGGQLAIKPLANGGHLVEIYIPV